MIFDTNILAYNGIATFKKEEKEQSCQQFQCSDGPPPSRNLIQPGDIIWLEELGPCLDDSFQHIKPASTN